MSTRLLPLSSVIITLSVLIVIPTSGHLMIVPDEFYSTHQSSQTVIAVNDVEGKGNRGMETGKQLVRLLAQHGYAYILNHSIPDHTVIRAFEESRKFFSLPQLEKKTFAIPSDLSESEFEEKREAAFERSRWNATMLRRPRLRESMEIQEGAVPRQGNPVPYLFPALKMLEDEGMRLSRTLLRLIGMGLGFVDVGVLAETTRGATDPSVDNGSLLRTMMYLGRRKGDRVPLESLFLPAHHDSNLVSLIYVDGIGGLEVYNRNGQWEALTPPDGSIVLVGGMSLRELSGGALNPVLHRVAPPMSLLRSDGLYEVLEDKEERQSIVHFVQPDDKAAISPPNVPEFKAKQFFVNMMEKHE